MKRYRVELKWADDDPWFLMEDDSRERLVNSVRDVVQDKGFPETWIAVDTKRDTGHDGLQYLIDYVILDELRKKNEVVDDKS